MIEHSPDITKLSEALNLAQSEMRGVTKDAKNPHFKNRYASLEAVIDTAKPVLTKNGLAFTQAPGALVDGAVEITTMLMHKSGQWIRSTLHMPVVKRDPQGVGSAITYGLRYSLMAVLGVPPTDDDDGEGAMDRGDTSRPLDRKSAPSGAGADQAGGEASNRAVSSPADPQQDAFGLPPIDEPTESQKLIFAALKLGIGQASTHNELAKFREDSIKPQLPALTATQEDDLFALYQERARALRPRVVS